MQRRSDVWSRLIGSLAGVGLSVAIMIDPPDDHKTVWIGIGALGVLGGLFLLVDALRHHRSLRR